MTHKNNTSRAQRELSSALVLATEAHDGQYDLAGNPYILHPIHVAMKMKSIEAKTVAILHDVVEDTKVMLEDLEELGFHQDIIDAVDAITWRGPEDYEDYIQRVKTNTLARIVKLGDLEHNMEAARLPKIGIYETKRMVKYWRAYQELK